MAGDIGSTLRDILIVLYLFALRIGVPILVTLMIGAWLQKFLQEREPGSQPTHVDLNRGQHCWDKKDCPEAQRTQCVAARRPDLPCWLALQVSGTGLRQECYSCPLYSAHAPALIQH